MHHLRIPHLLAGLLAVTVASALDAASAEPIEVGSEKQLLIDTVFFETSANIALRVHPATKTGERTLESDRPWENATLNWFSVLEDAGKYRMWYECYDVAGWPTIDDTSFCYAESTDAIHWTKPELGLFSYQGSDRNNILFRLIGEGTAHSRVHGAHVFIDSHAPVEARYKAVSQGQFADRQPPYRVAGMVSPDGLHWTRQQNPICDVFADSQYSGFWDDSIDQYVLYGRVNGRGRSIGRATSATFDSLQALDLVLQPEPEEHPETDLYNPCAIKYPGAANAYFMFPSMYQHTPDTLDIGLAVSRDGVTWSRPGGATPFIALGAPGTFDGGSLYMGQGMLFIGGEIWQYYSGSPLKHNEAELDALAKPENKRVFSRVVSRRDGFVSADAGETAGSFTTPPLAFRGNTLRLNIIVRDGGEARIALLDGDGNAIPGFGSDDCDAIAGDHLDRAVTWCGTSALPERETVRLRVDLKQASLFAFQFLDAPPGS